MSRRALLDTPATGEATIDLDFTAVSVTDVSAPDRGATREGAAVAAGDGVDLVAEILTPAAKFLPYTLELSGEVPELTPCSAISRRTVFIVSIACLVFMATLLLVVAILFGLVFGGGVGSGPAYGSLSAHVAAAHLRL